MPKILRQKELRSGLCIENTWGNILHGDQTITCNRKIHFNDRMSLIEYWALMTKKQAMRSSNCLRSLTITERTYVPIEEHLEIIRSEEE
tara:strand:+ start:2227 stop:2493 length:267 start_codon:yes stop_codon:yes gene_type:complete